MSFHRASLTFPFDFFLKGFPFPSPFPCFPLNPGGGPRGDLGLSSPRRPRLLALSPSGRRERLSPLLRACDLDRVLDLRLLSRRSLDLSFDFFRFFSSLCSLLSSLGTAAFCLSSSVLSGAGSDDLAGVTPTSPFSTSGSSSSSSSSQLLYVYSCSSLARESFSGSAFGATAGAAPLEGVRGAAFTGTEPEAKVTIGRWRSRSTP